MGLRFCGTFLYESKGLAQLTNRYMRAMAGWGKTNMGNFPRRIKEASQRVQSAIADLKVSGTRDELIQTEAQFEDVLQEEKVYWSQRSREIWLREGDRNTRWFHQ